MPDVSYSRVNWEDSPSTNTPINAANLNVMDKGISDCATEINNRQPKTDNNLTTTAKTIPGAINELNADLGELASPFLSDDLTPTILDATIAYNSSYQAPKDGFYILQMSSSSSTDAPALYYNSNRTFPVSSIFIPTINYTIQVLIPLKKDTIIYTKNSSVTSYKVVGYLSKA